MLKLNKVSPALSTLQEFKFDSYERERKLIARLWEIIATQSSYLTRKN